MSPVRALLRQFTEPQSEYFNCTEYLGERFHQWFSHDRNHGA
ncbi:protein of unknown function (plasmid) [Cupriavidus taiwanensis]|uniref:Uncharacterized protein n=1 Tax=Cupriavidus taiwanensis TaxID=164546 RepID=A0A9Q7XU26_9BURK|nr:protein of unknown function [Cupriavidus taiwanensis]